jgi:hypothetical protein
VLILSGFPYQAMASSTASTQKSGVRLFETRQDGIPSLDPFRVGIPLPFTGERFSP